MSHEHKSHSSGHGHGDGHRDGIERTDAPFLPVVAGTVALLALTAVIMAVLWVVMHRIAPKGTLTQSYDRTAAERPQPVLQVTEDFDLAAYRGEEKAQVESYAPIEGDSQHVRIPVKRAMEMLLEHGMPVRRTSEVPPAAASLGAAASSGAAARTSAPPSSTAPRAAGGSSR